MNNPNDAFPHEPYHYPAFESNYIDLDTMWKDMVRIQEEPAVHDIGQPIFELGNPTVVEWAPARGTEITVELAEPVPARTRAAPVYELGRVDPIAIARKDFPEIKSLNLIKECTIHSGCDVRVFINEEVLGCAQAFSLHVQGDKELINLIGLVFEADGYVLGIPKRLNGKTIRIEAANEYGSRVEFINNRILQVDSFHVGATVDDMVIEWQLSGTLLPLEE